MIRSRNHTHRYNPIYIVTTQYIMQQSGETMEYKKQNGNNFAEPGQNGNPLKEKLTLSEEGAEP